MSMDLFYPSHHMPHALGDDLIMTRNGKFELTLVRGGKAGEVALPEYMRDAHIGLCNPYLMAGGSAMGITLYIAGKFKIISKIVAGPVLDGRFEPDVLFDINGWFSGCVADDACTCVRKDTVIWDGPAGCATFSMADLPDSLAFLRSIRSAGRWLFTGVGGGRAHTFTMSEDFSSLREVLSGNGRSVYKCCYFGDRLAVVVTPLDGERGVRIEPFQEQDTELSRKLFSCLCEAPPIEARTTPCVQETVEALCRVVDVCAGCVDPAKFRASVTRTHGSVDLTMDFAAPPPLPTGAGLASDYLAAVAPWAAAGLQPVSAEEFARRSAICLACPAWDPAPHAGLGRCRRCGCAGGRRWLAAEQCPLDKW